MVAADAFNLLGEPTADAAKDTALQLAGNPTVLVIGIVLIIATVLVILFIKKIVINSVLGVAAWAVLQYGLNIQLPFIPSLVVSIVFGLAGIGVMLLLRFLAVI